MLQSQGAMTFARLSLGKEEKKDPCKELAAIYVQRGKTTAAENETGWIQKANDRRMAFGRPAPRTHCGKMRLGQSLHYHDYACLARSFKHKPMKAKQRKASPCAKSHSTPLHQ